MQEIIEEYGEFIIEVISCILLFGILTYFFMESPMIILIQKFMTSILGGSV